MKVRKIREMIEVKEQIERGAATPANVWELRSDGKGGFTRRNIGVRRQRLTEEHCRHAIESRPVQNGFARQRPGKSIRRSLSQTMKRSLHAMTTLRSSCFF
jgi:hypothetical protein